MFKVSHENESRFWIARKDFKTCFEIFMNAGFDKLSATILTITGQHQNGGTGRLRLTAKKCPD